jgi:deoxycytidylate deaminase|tara:strand:+ start:2096 stop:2629 length:534 start_codon:yes stop_codon:yes gene_type:complete
MVDSQNALKSFNKLEEYKNYKKEIKKRNKTNIMSNYFEYFDDENVLNLKLHQKYYFNISANIAKNSNMFQKHGAVIVYKKTIIGTGYNSYTYNCKNTFSIHAEIIAINNAVKNCNKEILCDSKLYIVRIAPETKSDNLLKYSKPCLNCQKYINKFNIKKIYYSTNYDYDKIISNYYD